MSIQNISATSWQSKGSTFTNNPIYREHILDPSRKQDTLLKILRHSGASDLNLQNHVRPENYLFNDKQGQARSY